MARTFQHVAKYEREPSNSNWLATTLLVGVISLIAGGAGFVLPQIVKSGAMRNFSWEMLAIKSAPQKKVKQKSADQQSVFVPFGEAVVNLAEERLTRHLQVRITLLVNGEDEEQIEEALAGNRAVLMNWLISYLSDKSLEEVRGAAGVNRARRDIQDRFNRLLFADGSDKIRDVLFEEFTVR
jgi:flagellar protein FliL